MSRAPADRPLLTEGHRSRRRVVARARAWGVRLVALAGLVAVAALAVGLALAATRGAGSHSGSHSTSGGHGTSGGHRASRRFAGLAHYKKAPVMRPVTITVEASGDLLIHSPVWERALAGRWAALRLRAAVRADQAVHRGCRTCRCVTSRRR